MKDEERRFIICSDTQYGSSEMYVRECRLKSIYGQSAEIEFPEEYNCFYTCRKSALFKTKLEAYIKLIDNLTNNEFRIQQETEEYISSEWERVEHFSSDKGLQSYLNDCNRNNDGYEYISVRERSAFSGFIYWIFRRKRNEP